MLHVRVVSKEQAHMSGPSTTASLLAQYSSCMPFSGSIPPRSTGSDWSSAAPLTTMRGSSCQGDGRRIRRRLDRCPACEV